MKGLMVGALWVLGALLIGGAVAALYFGGLRVVSPALLLGAVGAVSVNWGALLLRG